MELILWLGCCIAIGWYANSKNRSALFWGLLAFIFSPLLVGVVLALMKDKKVDADISEIRMEHQQLRDRVATDEKINEMRYEHLKEQLPSGTGTGRLSETEKMSLLDSDYKLCPFCKEKIKKDAIKCRHCHQMLDDVKTELCPFCKEEICVTDTVCPHCASRIERTKAEEAGKVVTSHVNQAEN